MGQSSSHSTYYQLDHYFDTSMVKERQGLFSLIEIPAATLVCSEVCRDAVDPLFPENEIISLANQTNSPEKFKIIFEKLILRYLRIWNHPIYNLEKVSETTYRTREIIHENTELYYHHGLARWMAEILPFLPLIHHLTWATLIREYCPEVTHLAEHIEWRVRFIRLNPHCQSQCKLCLPSV